ncbi:MAG: hypothetical protein K2W85_13210 [Phycisphaerales bacterium]|nr:hypothetical protein [Phycisphaerales bacterium]
MNSLCLGGRAQRALVGLGVCGIAAGASHASNEWIEPRSNDAAEYAILGQIPIGVGSLFAINGSLDSFEMNPGSGSGSGGGSGGGLPYSSGQDFFQIYIPNPSVFSAEVVSAPFNSKLYLFNMSGFGLLTNDNISSGNTLSRITPSAVDGSFTLTVPGIYAIGISGNLNAPLSSGGPIFPTIPFGVQGPTGPGGAFTHNDWQGDQSLGGYRIELTGAEFLPTPGTGGALALMGVLGLRRRRARA